MPSAHEAEGYDRCDGPHCQAYGGVSAEHPMTDRAVADTAGRIVMYDGQPAHAYFSSTCGGHTEDVSNVFPDDSAPYLRGVACYPESVEFVRLPGRQLSVDFQRVDGRTAHGVFARLIAAGVVTDEEAKLGVFSRKARADESTQWLRRAAAVAAVSLDEEAVRSLSADSALGFVRSVLRAIGASSQERLIAPQDLTAAARFREMQGLGGDDLTAALLALKAGLLPEGLEPGWGQARLSRGNVLEILEGWLHAQGKLEPPPVRFVGAKGSTLQVLSGRDVKSISLAPGLMLLSGRPQAPQRMRDAVELKLGDRLRIHLDANGQAKCIEVDEDPDGASLDRLSAHSWWSKRIPMTELADSAAQLGMGSLRDLRVTRVSDAGRVVGLELTDAARQARELTGFSVREFLGLPDSRCDLHFDRDDAGRLVAVTATGRGWGHGVGLCQFGAFGMALQGATSGEILAHYYPGTTIETLK
jgi:stage II sporulation protein D